MCRGGGYYNASCAFLNRGNLTEILCGRWFEGSFPLFKSEKCRSGWGESRSGVKKTFLWESKVRIKGSRTFSVSPIWFFKKKAGRETSTCVTAQKICGCVLQPGKKTQTEKVEMVLLLFCCSFVSARRSRRLKSQVPFLLLAAQKKSFPFPYPPPPLLSPSAQQ